MNFTDKQKSFLLTTLIAFFIILNFLVINNNSYILNFDTTVNNLFSNNQYPFITNSMFVITNIGNVFWAFIIFLVFGIFLIKKNIKHFYAFSLATFLGAILPLIIKPLVHRIRPSTILEHDFSFPSAHATLAIVFLLSSIFFLTPYIKKGVIRNIFIFVTSIIFPLVAFSRIYLGVHWSSDVLAGIVLGAICFVTCELLSCYKKENVL